jgi:hypothetical protein
VRLPPTVPRDEYCVLCGARQVSLLSVCTGVGFRPTLEGQRRSVLTEGREFCVFRQGKFSVVKRLSEGIIQCFAVIGDMSL